MSLEKQVSTLVDSTNRLTNEVVGKQRAIDERVNQRINELNQWQRDARSEYPIYRLSKNQYGHVDSGFLVGFVKNSEFNIEISLHREIKDGIIWEKRDEEEKEILTAMGRKHVKHFSPETIRVLKIKWSGHNPRDELRRWTIYPHRIKTPFITTAACYAKLIYGDIRHDWMNGINSQWGVCGSIYAYNRNPADSWGNPTPGGYVHTHPYVYSESGEALFIWPAIVAGYVPLDRNNPQWGFYPYIGDSIHE